VLCGAPIAAEYYQVAGKDACPTCGEGRRAFQQNKGGPGDFFRATVFGIGGASAGGVIYALVLMRDFQLALLAILTGVLVGKAVLMGSRGRRGKRYQFVAVALTYLSITMSWVPVLMIAGQKKAAKQQQTLSQSGVARRTSPLGAAAPVVRAVLYFGVALVLPILGIFSLSFSGILNAVIIFFGLREAWRRTRPDNAVIVGPLAP
jgi:hypothetical protein